MAKMVKNISPECGSRRWSSLGCWRALQISNFHFYPGPSFHASLQVHTKTKKTYCVCENILGMLGGVPTIYIWYTHCNIWLYVTKRSSSSDKGSQVDDKETKTTWLFDSRGHGVRACTSRCGSSSKFSRGQLVSGPLRRLWGSRLREKKIGHIHAPCWAHPITYLFNPASFAWT